MKRSISHLLALHVNLACIAFRDLRCETRCHLRAEVDECIRRFPDVELSPMSGVCGHPRTSVVLGVGSLGRFTPKSGEGRK